MPRPVFRILLAAFCAAVLARIGLAEPSEGGTVTGAGTIVLRPKPTAVRVQVQVYSHGQSVELALQRLKARREAISAQMLAMKADKDSISFTSLSVAKTGPGGMPGYSFPTPAYPAEAVPYPVPPPATYEPLAPPSYTPGPALTPVPGPSEPPPSLPRSSTPVPETAPAPGPPKTFAPTTARRFAAEPQVGPASEPEVRPAVPQATVPGTAPTTRPARPATQELYTASMTLTAQWTLNSQTAAEVIVEGEAIRKKAMAAFGDSKIAEKLSAEEQELLEESRVGPPSTSWVPATPGTAVVLPTGTYAAPVAVSAAVNFLYVAVVSPQERKAALAEAFAKAKAQAAELAEAAGNKLGRIDSLSGEINGSRSVNQGPYGPYGPDRVVYENGLPMPPSMGENDNEATGIQPATLEFRVRVSAQFHLQ